MIPWVRKEDLEIELQSIAESFAAMAKDIGNTKQTETQDFSYIVSELKKTNEENNKLKQDIITLKELCLKLTDLVSQVNEKKEEKPVPEVVEAKHNIIAKEVVPKEEVNLVKTKIPEEYIEEIMPDGRVRLNLNAIPTNVSIEEIMKELNKVEELKSKPKRGTAAYEELYPTDKEDSGCCHVCKKNIQMKDIEIDENPVNRYVVGSCPICSNKVFRLIGKI